MHAARLVVGASASFGSTCSTPLAIESMTEPLRLATRALHAWFNDLVGRHGLNARDLRNAVVLIWFPTDSEYYCVTTCHLETNSGALFQKSSTSTG